MIEEAATFLPEPMSIAGKAAVHITSRGKLAYLLSNRTYVGRVRHKDKIYDGEHEAIIDQKLFDEVQRLLKTQAPARRSSSNVANSHLLTGLVYDEAGQKLRSVHTNRKGMRYRYYVSQALTGRNDKGEGWRLPAKHLEPIIAQKLITILQDRPMLTDWIQMFAPGASLTAALDQAATIVDRIKEGRIQLCRELVHKLIRRITLKPALLTIAIDRSAVVQALMSNVSILEHGRENAITTFECPLAIRRRGVEMRMVVTNAADQPREPDANLVRLVIKAQRYLAILTDGQGKTIIEVAKSENAAPADISRILPIAFLSPSITDSILTGTQPASLTAQHLSRLIDLPASWRQQSELLARF